MSSQLQRIDINPTFGACLIGAQISAVLYGLTTLQAYFYFVSYPDDSRDNKALVYIIWLLDTLHIVFASISVYHYLVTNYDNPSSLAFVHWSLIVSVAVNIVIACIVQTFFTIQIFLLANSRIRWWLSSIIGICIFAHLSFGVELITLVFIKKEFVKLSQGTLFASAVAPFGVFTIMSDILIAGSLCVLLYRSRTKYRRTNTIITTLMLYAVNRCLLTSVVAIAEMIVYKIMPDSLWYMAVDFVAGKLFVNSFLATLNSRQSIRGHNFTSHTSDIAFSKRTDLTSSGQIRTDPGAVVVNIQSESLQWPNDNQIHLTVGHDATKNNLKTPAISR